jgi:predicted nucleic acid-binding protein
MPSIPTEALLDVNVIIASVFADHVMHLPARRFVESLERFYTTPTIQGGFLRFATRPLKSGPGGQSEPRLTMSEALAKLREFTGAEGHMFVSDDAPFYRPKFAFYARPSPVDGRILAAHRTKSRRQAGITREPNGNYR